MSLELLKETNPDDARFLEDFQKAYCHDYDFSNIHQQARYVEAIQTLARFIASKNLSANIKIETGKNGISGLFSSTCAAEQLVEPVS